jgi:hypothetical protein
MDVLPDYWRDARVALPSFMIAFIRGASLIKFDKILSKTFLLLEGMW